MKIKKTINQFQVRYMSNPVLNINKAFRYQVESNMELTFDSKIMVHFRKVLSKDKNSVLSLLMSYENRNNMIFQGVKCSCLL